MCDFGQKKSLARNTAISRFALKEGATYLELRSFARMHFWTLGEAVDSSSTF